MVLNKCSLSKLKKGIIQAFGFRSASRHIVMLKTNRSEIHPSQLGLQKTEVAIDEEFYKHTDVQWCPSNQVARD